MCAGGISIAGFQAACSSLASSEICSRHWMLSSGARQLEEFAVARPGDRRRELPCRNEGAGEGAQRSGWKARPGAPLNSRSCIQPGSARVRPVPSLGRYVVFQGYTAPEIIVAGPRFEPAAPPIKCPVRSRPSIVRVRTCLRKNLGDGDPMPKVYHSGRNINHSHNIE